MDEQKPKFVSRNVALGGNSKSYSPGPTRSQWHGMDLLTTTPSTNRRAMYTPPPQNSPNAQPAAAKGKSDDAAISARNIMIRRKLSERKRFDSADYAMKTVMRAMHAPGGDDESADQAVPPPVASPPQMPSTPVAMHSPRLSPSHARMGASVFKGALMDGDYEMKSSDEPGIRQPNQPQQQPQFQPYQQQQQQRQPTSAASRYGAIGRAGMTPAGALSARNIMIQRRMHEKRHFDSADWQLAQQGVQTDAAMDTAPIERPPSPMDWTGDDLTTPASSPSAARAMMMRNAQNVSQMSPSVRSSEELHRQQLEQAAAAEASKYAGLSGSNELLQRRLAEKKRFDSADYNMVQAARASPSSESSQLRRTALLRQQQNYVARLSEPPATVPAPPGNNFLGGMVQPPAAPMDYTPLAAAADAAAGTSKYGKLCAANVLLRKKLKERKRFDSADYHMERAKHHDSGPDAAAGQTSGGSLNENAGSSSPVLTPQTKHIKLSEGAAPSRWATHAAVVAMRPANTTPAASTVPARDAAAAAPVSLEGRLAARSVLIHRHLAERKRFDSADHFAAKAAANRGRHHHS